MKPTWKYRQDQETPSFAVEWLNNAGGVIDLSAHTFTVKLVHQITEVVGLTKTTGITGASTSPNVTVAWAPGELNIPVGLYWVHLTATSAGDRVFSAGDPPELEIFASP